MVNMTDQNEEVTAETGDVPLAKVLVVDDTPENLVALSVVLEDIECEVVTASSGQAALSILLKSNIDLVLLDVQMPEMDGFEVAELMRNSQRTKHIPIIFVTAISKEDRFVQKGYKVGAVDYLFKPIDPLILQSKVNFFLQLAEQKKRLESKLKAARASEEHFKSILGDDG